MTDSGMFAAFVTLALLVPAVLLLLVRFMAWALPPPLNWAVGFALRHPVSLSLLDASIWLGLFALSFTWGSAHWTDWIWRVLCLLFAAEAIWGAVRRSRAQEDFVTRWVKKRYTRT